MREREYKEDDKLTATLIISLKLDKISVKYLALCEQHLNVLFYT